MARPVFSCCTFTIICFLSVAAYPQDTLRLLFAGNSLTYTNDLPGMLETIAGATGRPLRCESICRPNYALEDHWNEGALQQRIARGRYDLVIVQQGPSSQEEGRKSLLAFGKKIQKLCLRRGSRLAFYMVWPGRNYYHNFPGVIASYTEAAAATESRLFPVGQVWRTALEAYPSLPLYGGDGFHPSLSGSLLAALVIYRGLFPEDSPEAIPYHVVRNWTSADNFPRLKKMVWDR